MPHGSRISKDGKYHYSVAMMSGELFEIDAIDMNATIDDVPEWDSFGHFELMMGIEKQFDIKIKMSDFPSMTSVPKIKMKIQEYEHE